MQLTTFGELSQKDIQTLRESAIIPDKTPTEQVYVFAAICREQGLSPFSKEIYLIYIGGKYTPITSINGLRKIADRAGNFAGISEAKFNLQSDGSYKTAAEFERGEMPDTCTITAFKIVAGMKCDFTATVRFDEFKSSRNQMWQRMPFQMIMKVAESHAIRKGWAISGLFVQEELDFHQEDLCEKVKEEMHPLHPSWNAVVKAIAKSPAREKGFRDRYFMTEENEKEFSNAVKSARNEI